MSGRVRVFSRVLIGRAVAATRTSALLAGAKVNPVRTDFHTVFAFFPLRMLDVVNALDVLAGG